MIPWNLISSFQTLLDSGFPLQKNKEILGRVIYNAIVMDGIKSKTIMTTMVFGKVKNKNTAIKWNLSYDDWYGIKVSTVYLSYFYKHNSLPRVDSILGKVDSSTSQRAETM